MQKFDLVTGFDLTSRKHQDEVVKYLNEIRPSVVTLGPPCTNFGHWNHSNQYSNLETWSGSRRVVDCLARFAARVRNIQSGAGRHLLVENPAGSELFHLPCSEAIWNIWKVVKINVPQCALALVVDGRPIYKNTTVLASSILPIEPFRGLKCICKSHGALQGRCGGVDKTKFAQAWPRRMCQRICIGMQALSRQQRWSHYVHDADSLCPVNGVPLGRRGRGRQPTPTEGVVSREVVIL